MPEYLVMVARKCATAEPGRKQGVELGMGVRISDGSRFGSLPKFKGRNKNEARRNAAKVYRSDKYLIGRAFEVAA